MRTQRFAFAFIWAVIGGVVCGSPAFAQEEKKATEKKAAEKSSDTPKKTEQKKDEPKKAEPKQPAPKKEAPKKTEPKKEEKKKVEPKKEEPKKTEPKKADDKKPAPKKNDDKKTAPKKDDDKKSEPPAADELVATTVVINLDNPTGVAVHSSGQVFIASHDGVHRFQPTPNTCPLAITGYPTDIYGKGPKYKIAALGVAFLDDKTLVVGDGSRPDGEELVRVYSIPAEHPGKPMPESEAAYTFGPIKAGEQSARGEGNYYGVAIVDGEIFVTNNGDDTKGWISRVQAKDGKWDESKLEPFIATKEKVGVDAPVPISVNENMQLVVGQMGEVNKPSDSLLTLYDPKTGDLVAKGELDGIHDVAGLAYSEKTKKWYATDFAWVKPEEGALYELDVKLGEPGEDKVIPLTIKKKKLMTLDKPTGIAFDKDGNLYIAVFGTGAANAETSPGKLLKVDASKLK